jgi:outer membrane protein OmpA-like peptidoglycan-associated protein
MMTMIFCSSLQLRAAQWPWGKAPDKVTAKCVVEPPQVEQGSSVRLKAKVEAVDTRKHLLSYVWSGNGGQILGSGSEVEIDASRLNPGVYTVAAGVQDAYKNRADCTASFQVIVPANPLTTRCVIEPAEVPAGASVQAKMEASDRLGQTLRYRWITNWGAKLPEKAEAQIQTAGMVPGEYSISGRVDDQWGHATDCRATLKIDPPPPPKLPQQLTNLAQIVFPFNGTQVSEPEQKHLQKILERIEHDPAGRISLESYAGPDEMDPAKLAEARAEAVKSLLLKSGVSPERVHTLVGLGGKLGGIRNRTLDVIWVPDGVDY